MGKGWSAMSHTILMATENSDWDSLPPVVQRTDGWEGYSRSGEMGQRFCHSSKGERVDSETLSNVSSSLVSQANVEKYIWNWKKYTIGLPAGYIKIMATKKIVVFNDQIWNIETKAALMFLQYILWVFRKQKNPTFSFLLVLRGDGEGACT